MGPTLVLLIIFAFAASPAHASERVPFTGCAALRALVDSHPTPLTTPERAALEMVEFVHRTGELPNNKTNSGLIQRIRKYRSDPAFQEIAKQDPKTWKLFSAYLLTPPEVTADETAIFLLKQGRVPRVTDGSGFYQRFNKWRKHPAFITRMREHPEAWEIFDQSDINLPHAERAGKKVLRYILEHKAMPRSNDSKFHWLLWRWSDNDAFRAIILEHPEARPIWEEHLRLRGTRQTGSKSSELMKRAAEDTTEHFLKSGEFPDPVDDPILSLRLLHHQEKESFRSELKKNPEVWRLFEEGIASFIERMQSLKGGK